MPYTALIPKIGSEKAWPLSSDSSYQQYETSVKAWCEAAYEEACLEASECEDLANINKYIDYLMGKQWPKGRPSYRSNPINNRTWRLFWELVSYLTDLRGTPEVFCFNRDFDPQAKILNNATLSWWNLADGDLKLAMIVVYALLSTGYGKLEWNPRLAGGMGDIDLIPIGPNELLPLKARHTLGSARAVIYRNVQGLDYFRQKYPLRGYVVPADDQMSSYEMAAAPPTNMSSAQFNRLSPGMQQMIARRSGPQHSAYPSNLYREFWIEDPTMNESNGIVRMGDPQMNWSYAVRPRERLYPRGRLIVMGGREIVHDGPNPYWHGTPPFSALRMNVVPWQFPGVSELRSWMPLQDIINNILAGVLDMIKKAVNPGFLAPKNAFSDNFWNQIDWSMPGAKGAYNAAIGHAPQWAPQPNLPGYVTQVMNLMSHEMDQASGMAAVSEAIRKKQIPSGSTLESIRDSAQAPVRLKGRNIESFLRDAGHKNIYNIFQFYGANRRLILMGPDGIVAEDFEPTIGSMVPDGVLRDDHIRQFGFMVRPGSMLAANQTDREMKLERLRVQGDLSRETLLESSNLNLNVPQELKRLEAETAKMAQMGAAARPARRR